MNEILKFCLRRIENIVGKGENAGYQHFLFFPTMFSNVYFPRVIKSRDCMVKGYTNYCTLLLSFEILHDSFVSVTVWFPLLQPLISL